MLFSNLIQYNRRKTNTVTVGTIQIGSDYPIRLQSMTNTDTLNVEATVNQCIQIANAGADLVRCTVQGLKEADAMREIKQQLVKKGYNIPLVADVHFNAKVAEVVAPYVDKVRINPGNFIDKRANFTDQQLSEEEYQHELSKLNKQLTKLLAICKEHGTAIRIGVNHGSLSDRIMSRYGDTPEGMVESALEFLRICRDNDFHNIILSMKSSNTRVMVHAYRLLVETMEKEEMHYPLHLGVTEAGEGEDGRIKSAVGIGTLLTDGIGDTIRVSLTEEPAKELQPAAAIANHFSKLSKHAAVPSFTPSAYQPYQSIRRNTVESLTIGGSKPVAVVADLSHCNPILEHDIKELGFEFTDGKWVSGKHSPDIIFTGLSQLSIATEGLQILTDESENFFRCKTNMLTSELVAWLKSDATAILAVESDNPNIAADFRSFFVRASEAGLKNPILIHASYPKVAIADDLQIQAACDLGMLLIDGFGEGVMLSNPHISTKIVTDLAFSLLQAARVRFSKTEFIACPGCGRTLFNLQKTLAEVKAATLHLNHLKVAVMGCIVNGPGEMADADYGYVGAGAGKVALYKGKEAVKKNVSQENAVNELIALIKGNGDWVEP